LKFTNSVLKEYNGR